MSIISSTIYTKKTSQRALNYYFKINLHFFGFFCSKNLQIHFFWLPLYHTKQQQLNFTIMKAIEYRGTRFLKCDETHDLAIERIREFMSREEVMNSPLFEDDLYFSGGFICAINNDDLYPYNISAVKPLGRTEWHHMFVGCGDDKKVFFVEFVNSDGEFVGGGLWD